MSKVDQSVGDNWSYKTYNAPVTDCKLFPSILQAGCPSCHPTNSVKELKGDEIGH